MRPISHAAATAVLAFGARAFSVPVANAVVLDSTDITIGVPNAALSGFTGPYANLHVDLTSSTTAEITFTSLTNGGFIYPNG